MQVLSNLWAAFKALGENLTTLAETVGDVNSAVRRQFSLDGAGPAELPHKPRKKAD